MKKILLITAALFSISTASAAQLTPSMVVQAIVKKTDLYSEGSAACNEREAFFKRVTYPTKADAGDVFVKTYKYTYDNIFDAVPKMQLSQAVGSFSDVKWAGASWKPWRRFDVMDVPEMLDYTFYVEVISPEYDQLDVMDYTAVCITVTKLR